MKYCNKLSLLFLVLLVSSCVSFFAGVPFSEEKNLDEKGELTLAFIQDLEKENEFFIKKAEEENTPLTIYVENRFHKYDTDNSNGLNKKEFKQYFKDWVKYEK